MTYAHGCLIIQRQLPKSNLGLFSSFPVSGGFATVNSDSSLNINEHFSIEAIRANLAETQRLSDSSTTGAEHTRCKG